MYQRSNWEEGIYIMMVVVLSTTVLRSRVGAPPFFSEAGADRNQGLSGPLVYCNNTFVLLASHCSQIFLTNCQ